MIETWVLELEVAKAEEEASVEERDGSAPLYKGCIERLLPGLKICLFPMSCTLRTVGLPTSVSIKESLNKGTRPLLG